ncbi:MAG: DUF4325 domain-containing protein [Candidatus Omnitrophota bacterium]
MDIVKLIIDRISKKGEVKASDIVALTGFSRTYVNRFFQQLRDEGKIVLIGKANKARYILAQRDIVENAKRNVLETNCLLNNERLSEDIVLSDIKGNTGIYGKVSKSISDIVSYAFLEMLNNAIEHSKSKKIRVKMRREQDRIYFKVADKGIGLFNNIMEKKNLRNEMEAIEDLVKGKQTTMPKTHSGEGIFFTSKVADILIIKSSGKKIIFNNLLKDIFIKDIKEVIGTKVLFSINLNSKNNLDSVFKQYTDDSFKFSKTKVMIKLYRGGTEYISRSQARRLVSGLDKFKIITLDFKDVKLVGQGFSDEIFRVWASANPGISIIVKNADENAEFMINRAIAEKNNF